MNKKNVCNELLYFDGAIILFFCESDILKYESYLNFHSFTEII
jgi:hypothetical protein